MPDEIAETDEEWINKEIEKYKQTNESGRQYELLAELKKQLIADQKLQSQN